MPVVTIRGQLGSGAREVGRQIAETLHVGYVDREIIGEVAARLHREEEEVIEKEIPPSGFLSRIAEALGHSYGFADGFDGAYLSIAQMPLDDTRYIKALESVVKELVRNKQFVILGRGSQFILKDYPGALHVLVVAPFDVRLNRVMEDLKLDQESAKKEIVRSDSSTREFIKRYFRAELEDPVHYDLVINTGHISFDVATSIVLNALSLKKRTTSQI
jgi:cytidylate kinase